MTLYIVAEALVGMAIRLGHGGDWYEFTGNGFASACTLAIFSGLGAVVFLEGRPRLFSAAPAPSKSAGVAPPLDGADPITLVWLREVMESDEA